jgi:hypothetical protein
VSTHADGGARAWLHVAISGVDSVTLHPVRNLVTLLAVAAMLVPYIAGVAVARGVEDTARAAADDGADLYVRAERFGLPVPVPSSVADAIAALEGVERVTPRIVFPVVLGRDAEPATLVGLPADAAAPSTGEIEGRLFTAGESHEVVVGATLFYRSARGERVATVVGIFPQRASPWLGRTLFTSVETAAWIADESNAVTQLLVMTAHPDPSDIAAVARAVEGIAVTGLRLEATSRDDLEFLLPRELFHREAALHLLYVLIFSMGIPVVLVTSGVGRDERRRETGLLRATGWHIDEILARTIAENITIAVAAGAASVVAAWAWLELAGGAGLGPILLRGDALAAGGPLPYRLLPGPTVLGIGVAVVIVLIGTISATWSAASASPTRSLAA